MDEREWLTSTNPVAMLRFLEEPRTKPLASDRKLRLFGCACVREVLGLLNDKRSTRALETAERFADGAATTEDLAAAYKAAEDVAYDEAWAPAFEGSGGETWSAAEDAARAAARVLTWTCTAARVSPWSAAGDRQAVLLRDLVPNPWLPPPRVGEGLRWQGGRVVQLAQAIYEERAFDRLPILADALEDAGADDVELLGHLRGPWLHALGCWALDLVVGKT